MKKIKCALALWAIIAIVSKLDSRILGGNSFQIGLTAEVLYLGTTPQDSQTVGENNNAIVDVDLTGVSTIAGLKTAIAAAVRTWATNHGFTVNTNNVLVQTYQAS